MLICMESGPNRWNSFAGYSVGIRVFFLSSFWLGRPVSEAIAIVACFYNVAMVHEPIGERCCQLFIARHTSSLGETQICGDYDDAGSFIELAEQVKQLRTAGLTERLAAQSVTIAMM